MSYRFPDKRQFQSKITNPPIYLMTSLRVTHGIV